MAKACRGSGKYLLSPCASGRLRIAKRETIHTAKRMRRHFTALDCSTVPIAVRHASDAMKLPNHCLSNIQILVVMAAGAWCSVYGVSVSAATWTVDPNGDDAAAGSALAPFKSWQRAANVANPGDVIEVRSGRYPINAFRREGVFITRSGAPGAPVTLRGIGAAPPVLDCAQLSYSGSLYCINNEASDWVLERIDVRGARQPSAGAFATGIQLSGTQRVRLSLVNSFEHEGTGIRIVGDSRDNVVDRCDAYRNYDPLNAGGNADGIAVAFTDSTATGNQILASRAFENSDDGFDLFLAEGAVRLEGNTSFRNGYQPGTPIAAGNGDGFKLGSNVSGPAHLILRNLAFANRTRGFDANGASGALVLNHNSAWQLNGPPFSLIQPVAHRLRNNLSFGSANAFDTAVDAQSNSWSLPVVVDADDFESLDVQTAAAPLLALRTGSDLVDRGVILPGYSYSGAARILVS